jgi:DnaJ-class molecular chaperone
MCSFKSDICPECGGEGEILDAPQNALDGRAYFEVCPACNGTGLTDHDEQCERELTSHGYTPCRCEERKTV